MTDLESWKAVVSSQVNTLVRENNMLRLEMSNFLV